MDRIGEYARTDATFQRPQDFSASDFFTAHQIIMTTHTDKLASVVLKGDEDTIHALAEHWYMGPRLVTKASNEASFLINEESIESYVPYFLLAFGRSVRIRNRIHSNNEWLNWRRNLETRAGVYTRIGAGQLAVGTALRVAAYGIGGRAPRLW